MTTNKSPLPPAIVAKQRKAIGAALRKLRKSAGRTQSDIADRAGTSLPPVGEIEAGTSNYHVDTLIRVAHANGVDLAQLLTDATPR
jgi:transcriptional regulator with XRE-family HTH domain